MKKLIPSLILALFTLTAQAQVWSAGGHFNGGIAFGELQQETGGLFIPSLSGILLYEARTAPIQIGLELGYGIYGSKMERIIRPKTPPKTKMVMGSMLLSIVWTDRFTSPS